MSPPHICLICHREIAHPGAECPNCKSQVTTSPGLTAQLLALIFAVMVVFFVATGFLTRSFRQERRVRGQEHFQRAETLADYGYYADAIREFSDALTFLPDDLDSRLGLAQSLYALGRFNEAETHLLDLRQADPTWARVNWMLGRIAARRGEREAAVNYYQTAIYGRWRLHPAENRLKVRLELVDLLKGQGETRQLVSQLLELLEEVPGNTDLRKKIGGMFLEAGSPGNARDVFEELVRRNRRDGEAQAGKGRAEFALGNYYSVRDSLLLAKKSGYDNEDLDYLVELTQDILELDPTARGIGRTTSLRRSQQLVERTAEAVEHCVVRQGADFVGPPAPPPAAVSSLLQAARGLNPRRQRATEETVGANIALAEELWNASREICAGKDAADPPLVHVLSLLSR
jgi:tetratricopeptide (TPR) repeat protein